MHDGERIGVWLPDEDGTLRAAQRAAEFRATNPGADVRAEPFTEADMQALDWQVELDRRSYAVHCVELEDAAEAAEEFAAKLHAARSDALGASGAVGLVSVLSTQKRPAKESQRNPRTPFRVSAERAAAVQAVGAFVAGGDDARMAKLRRAVGFSARAHGATRPGHRPDEARMVTLTYADAKGWRANHVRAYMDHVRKWHARQGIKCRYVWIAEIQDGKRRTDGGARGAVHYHCLLWVPVGTPHMPKSDLQGWWPHGSTRTEKADKAASYICSYLKKSNSKTFSEFPDGCRIYSVGGLEHSLRRARRWLGLPGFVQANSSYVDNWQRAPKGWGGWLCPEGEHYISEFRRVNVGGCIALQRVHTHARSIDASGPFAWLTDRPVALHVGSAA